MPSIRFCKKCIFSVFALCIVSVCSLLSVEAIFHLRLCGIMLEMRYFRAELVQLTVSRRDSELQVQRWKNSDCSSYRVEKQTVNDTTWKIVHQTASRFFKRTAETEFLVFCWILKSVQFGSVLRKPISSIFAGLRTPLALTVTYSWRRKAKKMNT